VAPWAVGMTQPAFDVYPLDVQPARSGPDKYEESSAAEDLGTGGLLEPAVSPLRYSS
jgi:hypothetical protein